MKKLLFTPLLFISAYLLMAQQGYQSNEYIVQVRPQGQRQTILITGYNGSSVNLTIPEQINGYPVIAIGDNAFRSRQIQTVVLPASLVSIGSYAFFDNRLRTISIPPSVTTIGIGAFDNNYITISPAASGEGGKTYVRTYTIEPAHGGAVYVERATQPVDITIHKGYNPVTGGVPGSLSITPQGGASVGVSSYVYTQPGASYTQQSARGPVQTGNTRIQQPGQQSIYPQYDTKAPRRAVSGEGSGNQQFVIVSEDAFDLGTNSTVTPGPPVQNFNVQKNYWGPLGARALPR